MSELPCKTCKFGNGDRLKGPARRLCFSSFIILLPAATGFSIAERRLTTDMLSPWSVIPSVKFKGHIMNQIIYKYRVRCSLSSMCKQFVQEFVLFVEVGRSTSLYFGQALLGCGPPHPALLQ